MSIIQYNFPTLIRFGRGARHELAEILIQQGLNRPLLVTDRNVEQLGFFEGILSDLGQQNIHAGVFSAIRCNPVISNVTEGVNAYREHDADSIVAIGGGGPMDVAKAIALMVHHPGGLLDYEDGKVDARPVDKPIPYVVAIPTTAGTGSEVGRSAVVSCDETNVKKIIFSPRLLPSVALVDPQVTLGIPAGITAATGMDALSHCVEAFVAPGFHPMADGIALEGIRLISQSLKRCIETPGDIQARSEMLMASLMGAVAFQKGLGVTHSMAHALSTVCDLHHGLANGIMLVPAMEFNAEVVPDRMARMSHAARADRSDAEGFLAWLDSLRVDVGLPPDLSQAGVSASELNALVDVAVLDGCHASNPRPVTREDFFAIFKRALT